MSLEDQLAQITLEEKEEETYEDRLARSTIEERFNTFEVGKPRRCFNLSQYNRDDIDREIEIWKFDRYYPINRLLGGEGNEGEINISDPNRQTDLFFVRPYR